MVFQCWSLQRLHFLGVKGEFWFSSYQEEKRNSLRDQKLLSNRSTRKARVYRKLPTQYPKVCSDM